MQNGQPVCLTILSLLLQDKEKLYSSNGLNESFSGPVGVSAYGSRDYSSRAPSHKETFAIWNTCRIGEELEDCSPDNLTREIDLLKGSCMVQGRP